MPFWARLRQERVAEVALPLRGSAPVNGTGRGGRRGSLLRSRCQPGGQRPRPLALPCGARGGGGCGSSSTQALRDTRSRLNFWDSHSRRDGVGAEGEEGLCPLPPNYLVPERGVWWRGGSSLCPASSAPLRALGIDTGIPFARRRLTGSFLLQQLPRFYSS